MREVEVEKKMGVTGLEIEECWSRVEEWRLSWMEVEEVLKGG